MVMLRQPSQRLGSGRSCSGLKNSVDDLRAAEAFKCFRSHSGQKGTDKLHLLLVPMNPELAFEKLHGRVTLITDLFGGRRSSRQKVTDRCQQANFGVAGPFGQFRNQRCNSFLKATTRPRKRLPSRRTGKHNVSYLSDRTKRSLRLLSKLLQRSDQPH